MKITGYEAICNCGNDIDTIFENAINGNNNCFDNLNGIINGDYVRAGLVKTELPEIKDPAYNLRCNKLVLKTLFPLKDKISEIKNKYPSERIAVITATTNSGVEEYEKSKITKHFEIGNPAEFLKKELNLNGFYSSVSTACSSGIKAFSLARDLFNSDIADCAIIACVDSFALLPVYGFHSLGVLTNKLSNPFSENITGMNIGEACAVFLVEKNAINGIEIAGIGESSDIFHQTTPDPEAKEAINAIKSALEEANLVPSDIDYINAHGTGTFANDIMETTAINTVFGNKTPVSSTKPVTGHCLGAAAGIETALCCKLLDNFDGRLYPQVFEGEYNHSFPRINFAVKDKKYPKCKICMCNSFGFGGTNAIMILRKNNEQ